MNNNSEQTVSVMSLGPDATTDNTQMLMVSDPITTVVSSGIKIWLCLGKVNGLKIEGKSVDIADFDMLCERYCFRFVPDDWPATCNSK